MVKTYNQFLTATLLLIFIASAAIAQPKRVREADRLYNNKEYYEALEAYKKASESIRGNKALKGEVTFKQALCYMAFNDTKKAEVWFAKAIKAKYQNPEAVLYLADMKRKNGKYDEALAEYENYMKLKPDDARGSTGLESCKLAVKWKEKPTKHEIINVRDLNSKYDDFSPIYSRKNFKEVIFTSSREGSMGNGMDGWTGEAFSDIYEAKLDRNGKWSTPSPFKEPLNSKYNDGATSLNRKYSILFFTRCEYDKNKVKGCQIFTTRKKGNTWDDPVLIPFAADTFTVGHPWISDDDQTLLFASDMPGGMGGRDIWMATYDKKSKAWSNPINLGPQVNTANDELYPTLRDDSTLYFSSNGHVGMGGLDLFEAKLSDGKWGAVSNLKFPLNSEADDFGIIFEGKKERGFFTSAREGGRGGADIYSFTVPPVLFTIGGIVYDFDTKEPVESAKVVMVDKDGMTYEITTDKTGSYYFDETKFVEENTYNITASANEYLNDKGTETTEGETQGKDYKKDFYLKTTKKGPIKLPEILYDLNSAVLRPESRDSLNGLIQTLRDNPNITIELMSHTDSRGSAKSNIDLSQRRAQSVVEYLVSQKIDPSRLGAKGYGETRLLNKCKDGVKCTEEEHQRNRRTEFKITATNFVPSEGSPEYVAPKVETVDEDAEIQTEVDEIKRTNIDLDSIKNEVPPTEEPVKEDPKK
ncbi:MAG: OmpA family protein [Bacteroidia bacterium]